MWRTVAGGSCRASTDSHAPREAAWSFMTTTRSMVLLRQVSTKPRASWWLVASQTFEFAPCWRGDALAASNGHSGDSQRCDTHASARGGSR
eukprot:scaffold37046_cov72-Phaeocystis_antarctica.AAC.4